VLERGQIAHEQNVCRERPVRQVDGVEEVLSRADAAAKYRVNPHRIGDLWVTACKDVVFGHLASERESKGGERGGHPATDATLRVEENKQQFRPWGTET
jgi:hypothetical protein